MWQRLVGLVLVGCSAARTPTPPVLAPPSVPEPPRPAWVAYALPAPVPPPPFHVECHAFSPDRPPTSRRKIYDFAPIELYPVRLGPLIAERPKITASWSSRDLRGMF